MWDQVHTPKGMNGDGNVADNDVAEVAQLVCNKPKRQAVKVRNPDKYLLSGRHLPTAAAETRTNNFVDDNNTLHSPADVRVDVFDENRETITTLVEV